MWKRARGEAPTTRRNVAEKFGRIVIAAQRGMTKARRRTLVAVRREDRWWSDVVLQGKGSPAGRRGSSTRSRISVSSAACAGNAR